MAATSRSGPIGFNRRFRSSFLALFVAAVALVGCGGNGDGEALSSDTINTAAPSSTPATTPTTSAPASTTTTPTTTTSTATSASSSTSSSTSTTSAGAEPEPGPAGIEAWLGTFEWVEFAEGDPGSDQTIVHELKLTGQDSDGSLVGTFTETGFQTNVSLDVAAYPGETGITVFATTDGPPFYTADQRLFALSGNPNRPTTTLGAVQAFLSDTVPETGSYFER